MCSKSSIYAATESEMAASSANNIKTIKFDTLATLIGNLFQVDAADCRFLFPDPSADEIDKKSIKAHRKLLGALSPVFSTMFNEHWSHNADGIVIEDATADDFGTFLDYFYKGTTELGDHNIDAIFYLAHKYGVGELQASCVDFIGKRLNANNVIGFYTLAIRFDQEELGTKCTAFITKNTNNVLNSDAFVQCDQATLMKLLEIKKMSCKEHIVFDACIKWAKSICQKKKIDDSCPQSLRTELADCFKLIRFKEMDRERFGKIFKEFPTMFTKMDSDDIFMHFLLLNSSTTDIRYKSIQIAVPKVVPEIVITFARENLITPKREHSVGFKITKSAMLSGVSFALPHLRDTSKYVKTTAYVYVYREKTKLYSNCREIVSSTEINRCNIQPPVFIEIDTSHTIEIKISGVRGDVNLWQTLFKQQPRKQLAFDFIPVEADSPISTLYFEPCTDENLDKFVNRSQYF